MKPTTKKIIAGLVIIVIISIGVLMARIYILHKFKTVLCQKLDTLKEGNLSAEYNAVNVQWYKNKITMEQLTIRRNKQPTNCTDHEFITVKQITITGLKLWDLVINKEVKIDEVHLHEPHIVLQKNAKLLPDSSSKAKSPFTLLVAKLRLTSLQIEHRDSAACKLIAQFNSSVTTSGLKLLLHPEKPFVFEVNTIGFDSSGIKFPQQLYTLNIKKAMINVPNGTVDIDTMQLTPHASKFEFIGKLGYSADRIEGIIPYFRLSGLRYEYRDTLAFEVKHTDMQFFLKVFRDKHLPAKNKFKPLPLQYLHDLPFKLKIDTLKITKSYVSYEEFPIGAKSTGLVFFDNLKATITNINGNKKSNGETKLTAQADFMGEGKLNIKNVFPLQANRNCYMEGTLKNFNLLKVNGMLKSAANMKLESGSINLLTFKFAYNETRSDGEVAVDYSNVSMVSFKKENTDEQEKRKGRNNKGSKENKLKTFIINSFVIKKDKNDSTSQRTGTISYYRNTQTSIFNYWWKSLLSGIKSALNIDKSPIIKIKKAQENASN